MRALHGTNSMVCAARIPGLPEAKKPVLFLDGNKNFSIEFQYIDFI